MQLMSDRQSSPLRRLHPKGFTLVELLIVVIVIGILVAIVMAVGSKVSSTGKAKLTEGAMKTLGVALSQFEMSEEKKVVPSTVEFANPSDSKNRAYHPVADAIGGDGSDDELLDSVALFIKQLDNRSSAARDEVGGISSKLIRVNAIHDESVAINWSEPHQPLVTVFDAWGKPMRYVHPAFDGNIFGGSSYPNGGSTSTAVDLDADSSSEHKNPFGLPIRGGTAGFYGTDSILRYNKTDDLDAPPIADGGVCPNNKPYFYSAGPDGRVGQFVDPITKEVIDYNADNVYIVDPLFSKN